MDMTVEVESSDMDGVTSLISRYVPLTSMMFPNQGDSETKQAYGKRVAYGEGMREAFAYALEVAIIGRRATRYGAYLKRFPTPSAFDIKEDLLHKIDVIWRESAEPKGDHWNNFVASIGQVILDYVFPQELEEKFEKTRRALVLAGDAPVQEGDDFWMMHEANKLEEHAEAIRQRAASVALSK
jgi:hypothetical protein